MAKSSSQRRRPHALSHGRPTSATSASSTPKIIAARHTRRLIRSHHTLQKQLAKAIRANDTARASALRAELEEQGGLEVYQAASVNGADKRRGGDTSKKLLEFLAPLVDVSDNGSQKAAAGKNAAAQSKWTMLDVGALSCDTVASRSGLFSKIERIDLRSRKKGILEQDFMQRPLPLNDSQRFDIVCLSLVLNYIPDAQGRGEMLRRVCKFLKRHEGSNRTSQQGTAQIVFPALFLVLPAPCIVNSRYLNHPLLERIMVSLGFSLKEERITAKLAYSLWRWHGHSESSKEVTFPKAEVNPGKARNNFAIVLE